MAEEDRFGGLCKSAQFICERIDPRVFAGSFDEVSVFLHVAGDGTHDGIGLMCCREHCLVAGYGDGIGCMVYSCGVVMVVGCGSCALHISWHPPRCWADFLCWCRSGHSWSWLCLFACGKCVCKDVGEFGERLELCITEVEEWRGAGSGFLRAWVGAAAVSRAALAEEFAGMLQ